MDSFTLTITGRDIVLGLMAVGGIIWTLLRWNYEAKLKYLTNRLSEIESEVEQELQNVNVKLEMISVQFHSLDKKLDVFIAQQSK